MKGMGLGRGGENKRQILGTGTDKPAGDTKNMMHKCCKKTRVKVSSLCALSSFPSHRTFTFEKFRRRILIWNSTLHYPV